MDTPVLSTKNQNTKGKGQYQKTLDRISRLKVIYKLSIKPFTFDALWKETRIQRNRLRKIVGSFIDTGAIITHKYYWTKNCSRNIEIPKGRTSMNYFILDLDSKVSLDYLQDIRYDIFVKDTYRLGIIQLLFGTDPIQFHKNQKETMLKVLNENITYTNQQKEFFKAVLNMDHSFKPKLYLTPDQINDYRRLYDKYSVILEWLDQDPLHYLTIEQLIKTAYGIDLDFPSPKEKAIPKQKIEHNLENCKSIGLSKFDVLISFSHQYPTRENYLELWNMIKQY